jgi:hypothetical protein
MKIPYSLKEKILLASLIHDMEETIENIKTDTVSVERKIVFRRRLTPSTIARYSTHGPAIEKIVNQYAIQGISRVIMSLTE